MITAKPVNRALQLPWCVIPLHHASSRPNLGFKNNEQPFDLPRPARGDRVEFFLKMINVFYKKVLHALVRALSEPLLVQLRTHKNDPLEREFIRSWDGIQEYYRRISPRDRLIFTPWRTKGLVLRFIAALRRAGYDRKLRAGQSLYDFTLSRSRTHGLCERQPCVAFSFRGVAMDVVSRDEKGQVETVYGICILPTLGPVKEALERLSNQPLSGPCPGHLFFRPERRALAPEELTLLEWLIANGTEDAKAYSPQLRDLTVVGSRTYGGRTIDLAPRGRERKDTCTSTLLASFVGTNPEGIEVAVILYARKEEISELQIYAIGGAREFSLPTIESLKRVRK